MTDDDLVRALRALDPARTPSDAPVPLSAERRLREILDRPPRATGGGRRRVLPGLAAAVAAVVALVVGAVVWWPAPTATALTPAPLQYSAVDDDVPALLAAAQDRLAQNPGRNDAVRRSLTLGWFFSVSVGDPDATVFRREWVDVSWNADLSGSVVTTTAESTDAAGDTVPADGPAPGTVVGDMSYVRGQFHPLSSQPPPATVEGMREVMTAAVDPPSPLTSGDAIIAAQSLLGEWTFSDAQEAALLDVVRSTSDLRLLGRTTDRVGRAAIGFSGIPTGTPNTDATLLVSLDSGRILGVETSLRAADEDLGLPAGSVTSYTLWDVEDRPDAPRGP
ncbi:MAG: hypothetical protein BGO45_14310 [Microbacterium sp. 71-36]|uniref:hypothetical protein n=1 Tax=unclassified Microbacterium TaxID=2609290 RepID=UPI00086BD4D2|nr:MULTISPECIES: hypothetical protein [unclassified Microbacterium]MBN9212337.1 hypothetical protein [Microbacterium sp.]ODT38545.1 MAG: hypothetical protein ABS60_10265 [Microbacterium sp. SCN 71-17]OJV77875.1 MAG: hypothetical protein BGO45_14310 [Microbacterium sp. 71-36]